MCTQTERRKGSVTEVGTKADGQSKDTTVKARLDKETLEKLDCLVAEQNSDRSKVIRKGIEIQYSQREK